MAEDKNKSSRNKTPKSNITPNMAGGLGVQGFNTKDYLEKPTFATGKGTTTATRNKQYGGYSAAGTAPNVAGGLGFLGYRASNAANKPTFQTDRKTPTSVRNKMYGGVPKNRKPVEITIPGGGSPKVKVAPTSNKSKQMGINRTTGSTLGFTTGSRTGSTATKSGVAGKTKMSGSQRMAQNAFNKGGVAGPRKDSSGRNVSSASGKRK